MMMKTVGPLLKLAGQGAAFALGGAVAEHVGKETGLLDVASDFVRQVAGLGPAKRSAAPALPAPALPAPSVGEASHASLRVPPQAPPQIQGQVPPAPPPQVPQPEPSEIKTVCPCQLVGHDETSFGVVLAGAVGERVTVKQCDVCRAQAYEQADHYAGLTLGWAEAWGIPETGSACGTMPRKEDQKFHGFWGFKSEDFYRALSHWQKCADSDRRDKAAQAKKLKTVAHSAAKTQAEKDKQKANFALQKQKERFDAQINSLRSAEATAKSESEKQALQQQIQQLQQQSQQAQQMQEQLRSEAKDAASAAQVQALQQQVQNAAAKGPSGMDQLMQMMMMKSMMSPQAPPPPPPPPIIMPAPAPAPPWGYAPPPYASPSPASPPPASPPYAPPEVQVQVQQVPVPVPVVVEEEPMDLLGTPKEKPESKPKMADEGTLEMIGMAGLELTEEDASEVYSMLGLGWGEDEIREYGQMLAGGFVEPEAAAMCVSGCSVPGRLPG
ncbi:MAG TPA: hypothetical protein PLN93_08675 [Vicinamibacterales bacterium]|nr:hypothetical protein [Vicinamibacterales bacterium]HPK72000.1 hypothetical protein [Vicinamibacterales bacterium]